MSDIIARLRLLQKHQQDNDAGEAADTIEALQAERDDWKDAARSEAHRVNELTAQVKRLIEERYVEGWNDAIANSEAVTDLRAENARLCAALKPLSEIADNHSDKRDDYPLYVRLLVGELRAARAAYRGER